MDSKPSDTQSHKPYEPTEQQLEWIGTLLSVEQTLIDPDFDNPGLYLTYEEAKRRRELVSDIEYTFSLALKKGDFYCGQAEINFYLEQMPDNDHELFLDANLLVISELTINE